MKEKKKQTKTERNKRVAHVIVKVWEINDFVVSLNFAELICKASLLFKSNVVLVLSIILKERELKDSTHVVVECRCWKFENCYPLWYVP